jgi:hypothetical protein
MLVKHSKSVREKHLMANMNIESVAGIQQLKIKPCVEKHQVAKSARCMHAEQNRPGTAGMKKRYYLFLRLISEV